MTDERVYDADPERVFAALIHALASLAAKVERVEGFGTRVTFRIAREGGHDTHLFSGRVVPMDDGAVVQIHLLDSEMRDISTTSAAEFPSSILDAVQQRLEHGPRARPTAAVDPGDE
jgi:hypothetical protein